MTTARSAAADIVCLATRRIDNPLPTNVQQLMTRLATTHRVLYAEPPVDPVFLLRNPAFFRRYRESRNAAQPAISIPVVLPWGHRRRSIGKLNERALRSQVRRAIRRSGFEHPILWFFSPLHAHCVGALGERAICYHITDDYSAMPWASELSTPGAVREAERIIIEAARCVFVTSPQLARDRGLSGDKFHVVPNVADVDHFSSALQPDAETPDDIAAIPQPIAGFVGAIDDYKIDFTLLAECARQLPDVSFVLIGPVGWADDSTIPADLRLPNVHLLGPRPYAALPQYLRAFRVGLIPYRVTEYTRYCSPLKLHEYLAAGLPVVATDLPAFNDAGGLVSVAADPHSFTAAVRDNLESDPEESARRSRFARQHSWTRRIEEIEAILAAEIGG